jgi:hypothetical protein
MDGYLPFALLIISAGSIRARSGGPCSPSSLAEEWPLWCSSNYAACRARLIAMAMVSTLAGGAQAQEYGLEAECRNLLHGSVFDCGCTAKFLENHMRGEHADIMLRLWAYGVNGDTRRSEVHDLYLHYGSKTISDAVMNFHRHRDLLRRYCAQGDGPAIAD